MLMIVRSFHGYQSASLIVYSSFDHTAVDPVDSVRELLLHFRFAHLPKLVSQKTNDTCLVTECKPGRSLVTCLRLAGGQDGPDLGCHEWAHGGCQGSDRGSRRRGGQGEGEAHVLCHYRGRS
jgi:hypothetical protein